MSFDPAELAALCAWLARQSDDGQFVLEAALSAWQFTQQYPAAMSLAPGLGQQAWAVGYRMLYRRQTFKGQLVVAVACVEIAKCLLAQDAQYQVLLYDQRHPVTEYTAGGRGVKAGP